MIIPNEEYIQVSDEYFNLFGYGIELRKIPVNETIENLIKNIKLCIDSGIDDLPEKYPALGISYDNDILT